MVLALFLWLVLLPLVASAIEVGQRVTYTDETGARWCARVGYVEQHGIGGAAFAWVEIDADPRRVFNVLQSTLSAGCAS